MDASSRHPFIEDLLRAFHEDDSESHSRQKELENLSLLSKMYESLFRRDFDAVMDAMDEEIELEIIGPHSFPFCGRSKGRQDVLDTLLINFSKVTDQEPTVLSVVAQGDSVVVIARERGVYRPSRRSYNIHWVQHFIIREGRTRLIREFVSDIS